jgi:hypothetical protein
MALPPDVQAAKDRMEKAKAELRANIESSIENDRAKRVEVIEELQVATDDFMKKIDGLG